MFKHSGTVRGFSSKLLLVQFVLSSYSKGEGSYTGRIKTSITLKILQEDTSYEQKITKIEKKNNRKEKLNKTKKTLTTIPIVILAIATFPIWSIFLVVSLATTSGKTGNWN